MYKQKIEKNKEITMNELKENTLKINQLKETIKSLQQRNKYLQKHYKTLQEYYHFNRFEIFNIICYLVSKMEKTDYVLRSIPILVADGHSFYYKMVYLTENTKETAALLELKGRFSNMIDKSMIEINNVSDNYLQLAIYKENDSEKIIFDDLNSNDKPYDYMKETPIVPHTKIYDERFNYIIDFLNYVIDYRFNFKSLSLTLSDMYELVDNFIENYSKKVLIKSN